MTGLTRRSFLNQTGAAVGTAAIWAHGLAAKESASERIQVGMVGVGGRAGSLLQMFARQSDVDVVLLADIDAERLQQAVGVTEQIGGRRPEACGDFRRILDNQQIDAVVVGTPDHWHAIPTILACAAGKDVYVEKPDGHNMVEGQRMVEAMRRHQRIVQLGTQSRTSRHFRSAIDWVASGKLGRVLVAKAWESARQGSIGRPADSDPPPGVDYDMWLGPAPKRPFNVRRFHGNWRWFYDYGTGDVGNDGVHRIDVARWALSTAVVAEGGQPLDLPTKVSAAGGKWYFDDMQQWPDTLQVTYEFASSGRSPGRILTYEMRVWTPYPYSGQSEGVALYGDQGYMVLGNERWQAYHPDGTVWAEGSGGNDGMDHVRNFLDCVKTRKRPAADLETVGHPASIFCHAGNIAWRTGRQLVLDAQSEQFDDEEANQLRGREYRKPWELPTV